MSRCEPSRQIHFLPTHQGAHCVREYERAAAREGSPTAVRDFAEIPPLFMQVKL